MLHLLVRPRFDEKVPPVAVLELRERGRGGAEDGGAASAFPQFRRGFAAEARKTVCGVPCGGFFPGRDQQPQEACEGRVLQFFPRFEFPAAKSVVIHVRDGLDGVMGGVVGLEDHAPGVFPASGPSGDLG